MTAHPPPASPPRRPSPLRGCPFRGLASLALSLSLLFGVFFGCTASAQQHTVKSGDILGRIAEKYGCQISDLKKANRLRKDNLSIGQVLKLPRSCSKLPKNAGKSVKSSKRTRSGRGKANARRGIARNGPTKHKVKKGENLGLIARKYGCTATEIRKANRRKNDRIQAGKTLTIPLCYTDASGRRRVTMEARRLMSKAAVRPSLDQAAVTEKLPPQRDDIADGMHPIDNQTLAKAMHARGFYAPPRFRALVVELTLDDEEASIVRERWFDYEGTAQSTDWNVGSTIKIFAAIAALEYLGSMRMGLKAAVTFFDSRHREKAYRVAELISDALSRSDNIAYNRLAQLAGYDFMNGQTLKERLGLSHSGIHRPYEKRNWIPLTGAREFRHSPKVVLTQGKRTVTIPERAGAGDYACGGSAACTTLAELSTTMRQLMLNEILPENERLQLDDEALEAMRAALSAKKKRGTELADGIRAAFNDGAVVVYHKPGFAEDWMSDVAYVAHLDTPRRWIVALAGYPGRTSIVSASHAIGHVLANDDLERPWPGVAPPARTIPIEPPAPGAAGGEPGDEESDGEGEGGEEPDAGAPQGASPDERPAAPGVPERATDTRPGADLKKAATDGGAGGGPGTDAGAGSGDEGADGGSLDGVGDAPDGSAAEAEPDEATETDTAPETDAGVAHARPNVAPLED